MQGVKPKFGHRYWPEAGPLTWLYLTYFFWLFIGLSAAMLFVRGWREHLGEPCDRQKSFHTIYLPGFQRCIGGATNFPLWFNIPVQPYGNVLVPFVFSLVLLTQGLYSDNNTVRIHIHYIKLFRV